MQIPAPRPYTPRTENTNVPTHLASINPAGRHPLTTVTTTNNRNIIQ